MKTSQVFKRIYEPVFKKKKIVICQLINNLAGGILPLLAIYSLALISREIEGGASLDKSLKIILAYSVLGLILALLEEASLQLSYVDLVKIRMDYLNAHMDKIVGMDFKYYEDANFMANLDRAFMAMQSHDLGIEAVYHRVFSLGKHLVTILILVYILPQALVALLFLGLLGDYYLKKKILAYRLDQREELTRLRRRTNFYIDNGSDFNYGKDMRNYPIQDRYREYFQRDMASWARLEGNLARKDRNFNLLGGGILLAINSFSLYYLLGQEPGDLASLILGIAAINLLMAELRILSQDLVEIKKNIFYVRELLNFMDQDLVEEGGRDIDFAGQPIEIEFRQVSFSYPNSQRKVLDNLSFTIGAGERLALVGLNGAGKTSIVKLMTGLYRPDSGDIFYNGINSKEFSKRSQFDLFSAVFQDVKALAFTVGENVAGHKEGDRARIEGSLKKAGLYEKISLAEKGIDSHLLKVIHKDGLVLSGGEEQKLIIARGIYKQGTSALVMDEPTASLDALAEEKIYRELDKIMEGKTSLFISHRLASTKFCHRIILLDQGRLVEIGSHQELLEKKGLYSQMYQAQGKYYKEDYNEETKNL